MNVGETVIMSKEDLIVLCEEAINILEASNIQNVAWENLHTIRASLIEGDSNYE